MRFIFLFTLSFILKQYVFLGSRQSYNVEMTFKLYLSVEYSMASLMLVSLITPGFETQVFAILL